MTRHPSAGKPIKITQGPHKDKYFIVVDFLTNQFQGKSIGKIDKAHPDILRDYRIKRKEPIYDDKIVFGKLYPTMEFICVHDTELQVLTKSDQKRFDVLSGGLDAGPSETNSDDAQPGEPGLDGRSVPSAEAPTELRAVESDQQEPSGPTGSGERGPEEEHPVPSEQKGGAGKPAKRGKQK